MKSNVSLRGVQRTTKQSKPEKIASESSILRNDMPVQYQNGFVEFYKLKFKVTPDVLIPRPETELLVDAVINLNPKKVLDLGTGSGNIAISIAKNIPDVKIIATDVSREALGIAGQNAKFHGVEKRIQFMVSDLLENIDQPFDVIVTNLPYLPTERINYLDSSVKNFEPHVALDGGQDGFVLYRKLFREMKEKNIIPKYLIGEIDYTHGESAVIDAKKYFPNAEVRVDLDLAHKQRILMIEF